MIIGYDGGYGYIKTSEGVIFPSKMKQFSRTLKDEDNMRITFKDKTYIIGEGSYEVDLNKFSKESSLIYMLTALALSSQQSEFQVVAGLPIKQYKKYKDEFKNAVTGEKINFITLGERERTIIIDDFYVFPQSLGSFYSLDNKAISSLGTSDILIIDIGTRTVDISLISYKEGKRVVDKYSTILEGTISLYSDIIYEINAEFELDLRVEEAENILKHGLYLGGIKQDLKFTKDIILEHINEIFKEIDLNYPIKTSAAMITGGGAYLYGGIFKKRYRGLITMNEAQFSNANGFKKVGEGLWQK